ncbi:MAG: DNA-directed RNA polymerase subunit D [Candidatus Diapherotrites archaeon]|nr:DNA-directed RNA polymerase subunit D [Candidatus Diapherotrites archaeon]
MDVKKVYEDGNVAKYLVKGTNYTFMNTIRRTIMTNVPCLAVESVQIYENDSIVFDEMLSNRLGLLPIKTDVKGYKKGDTVKLVLEKTGPGIVTSKDIKCTDPKIEVAEKKIPITKLGKEQNIKIEMTAVMNTGDESAKFQPAIVSYNEMIEIKNDKNHDTKAILLEMPKGSIEVKAGKLFFTDPYNVEHQNQHLDILKKHGVKFEFSSTDFVLSIESTGQMTQKEVLEMTISQLVAKLDEFEEQIKKL